MSAPDRVFWHATPGGGGYLTRHEGAGLTGEELTEYAPSSMDAAILGSNLEATDRALAAAGDEVERLTAAYEETKAREARARQQADALLARLEDREAALGRATSLARAAWDVPGLLSDAIRRRAPGRTIARWSDVLRWIADGPGTTGGQDGQAPKETSPAPGEPTPPEGAAPGGAGVDPAADYVCLNHDPGFRRVCTCSGGGQAPGAAHVRGEWEHCVHRPRPDGPGERMVPPVSADWNEPPIRPGNGWTH